MKKLSKHLSIYSSQYFSIASIIARVTVSSLLLGLPILIKVGIFQGPQPCFVFVNLIILILLYHVLHFFKKSLFSENGIIGLYILIAISLLFLNSKTIWDFGFFMFLYFVFIYHTILGLTSIFKDYSYSKNNSVRFYNINFFIFVKSSLLVFYFISTIF